VARFYREGVVQRLSDVSLTLLPFGGAQLLTADCIDTDPPVGGRYLRRSDEPLVEKAYVCSMRCGSCSLKTAVRVRKRQSEHVRRGPQARIDLRFSCISDPAGLARTRMHWHTTVIRAVAVSRRRTFRARRRGLLRFRPRPCRNDKVRSSSHALSGK
jgi:hypothetical protein